MKAIAINGSPRKGGNTELALMEIMSILESRSFETEIVRIGGKAVRGCLDCKKCKETKDGTCAIDDHINALIKKVIDADAIILGSPVYFSNVTPEMKAFIDRAGRVCRTSGYLLKDKIGAPVAVARRSGKNATIAALNYFFLIEMMTVPGSLYWNGLIGYAPGDVLADEEGLENIRTLAGRIADLCEARS